VVEVTETAAVKAVGITAALTTCHAKLPCDF